MVQIRPASDHEMEGVRGLFHDYAAELGIDLEFQNFQKELRSLPGDYVPPEGRILVAVDGGLPVGCVAMRPLGEKICEMKRLYVQPCHRGKGIARRLVAGIIATATQAGYFFMRLDTLDKMKAARSLYESFGFRPIEAYYHNPIEDTVYMELDLQGSPKRTDS